MTLKDFLISPFLLYMLIGSTSAILGRVAECRELSDITLEITSEKKGAEAKQDAFDQATEQATLKSTEDLLGAERTAHLWPSLRTKLLKASPRYILFIKGSSPQDTPTGTKLSVSLRLSPDNLETLLREEGLMNAGAVRILPLVEIDGPRGRYLWWADMNEDTKASTFEAEVFKRFFVHLSAKFKSKNIYVLDPTNASFRMGVPAAYRSENLRRDDQVSMAQYLKADVVLSGRIVEGRPDAKLNYDLQLWQGKSGRNISDIQHSESLNSEAPKALLAQVDQASGKVADQLVSRLSEALAGGNLNLNVVRISVSTIMSYRQETEFKHLLAQLREVRVLKERLFEPGKVVFEAETSVNGIELGKALQKARFPLYAIQVESIQDNSLALSVRALSSASAQ